MEENRLKKCLKGVKGVDGTSGGGWICLSETEVHLTVGDGGGGGVTNKQWEKMDP